MTKSNQFKKKLLLETLFVFPLMFLSWSQAPDFYDKLSSFLKTKKIYYTDLPYNSAMYQMQWKQPDTNDSIDGGCWQHYKGW